MLMPGEWVEIRPASEIIATLDESHSLEGMPFMPEMLPFRGRRFRVAMRAALTCVHPPQVPLRRLRGMPIWREVWLRRPAGAPAADGPGATAASRGGHAAGNG
jgi:hypothetical protein